MLSVFVIFLIVNDKQSCDASKSCKVVDDCNNEKWILKLNTLWVLRKSTLLRVQLTTY